MPRTKKAPPTPAPVPRRWLTPEEAAEYLGVSQRWFERRREERNGPPFHKPTQQTIRYDLAELDRWMEAQRVDQAV